jgi:hypothetical protein
METPGIFWVNIHVYIIYSIYSVYTVYIYIWSNLDLLMVDSIPKSLLESTQPVISFPLFDGNKLEFSG